MTRAHQRWLRVATALINGDATNSLQCPSCGHRGFESYFVSDASTRVGWGIVLCPSCRTGVHMSRVKFAVDVQTMSFEEAQTVPPPELEHLVSG